MNVPDMLSSARSAARKAHAGQVDKAGRPYFEHLERVAQNAARRAMEAGLSEEEILDVEASGILHDILEDTDIKAEDLEAIGMSARVIGIVEGVSRPQDDRLTYQEWIQEIADSGDVLLIIVKLADNEDNGDPGRLQNSEGGSSSMAKRYARAKRVLEEGLARAVHRPENLFSNP